MFTVYKLLDANNAPLYVGCTKDLDRRLAQHAARQEWWAEVVRVKAKAFDDMDDAAQAELSLMQTLRPQHNKDLSCRYRSRPTAAVPRQGKRVVTMLTMAPLGEKLKEERRRAALTQGELAEKAGVGINTIVRIETGDITEPRVSTLRKLANALGIDTRDLLEGS